MTEKGRTETAGRSSKDTVSAAGLKEGGGRDCTKGARPEKIVLKTRRPFPCASDGKLQPSENRAMLKEG